MKIVVINAATGRHVMSQGAPCDMEAMHANARAAGLAEGQYEIREMSDAELAALLAAQPETAEERQARLKREIERLEAGQPRALREAALGAGAERLQEIEDGIAALRAQLAG